MEGELVSCEGQMAQSTPNITSAKIGNNQTGKLRLKENHQITNISSQYANNFTFIKELDPFASPIKDSNPEKVEDECIANNRELDFGSPKKKLKFPESFNPRKELNMPHKEKVNKWIKMVPEVSEEDVHVMQVESGYNPDVPTTDEFFLLEENDELNLENDSDVINFQSKLITVLVNKDYLKDDENVRKSDGLLIQGSMNYMLYHNGLDYIDYKNMSFDQQSVYTYEQ